MRETDCRGTGYEGEEEQHASCEGIPPCRVYMRTRTRDGRPLSSYPALKHLHLVGRGISHHCPHTLH